MAFVIDSLSWLVQGQASLILPLYSYTGRKYRTCLTLHLPSFASVGKESFFIPYQVRYCADDLIFETLQTTMRLW